ncbi:MAG: hypothetical protein NT069_03960, partial [Planctomycetota bacterium]|nr:hypothetical protein [Planctomycetota bacterium]
MRTRRSGFKALTIVLGGLLAAVMISSTSSAVDIIDDPMQIDERAAQLIQSSNSLCWEMHRFHQRQPDFREAYQATKEIWSRARQLRDALRSGTVETEVLVQNMTQIDEIFTQVETSVSKWGNGDRSLVAPNSGPVQRTVVTPGVEIDIPFVGIVGGGSR